MLKKQIILENCEYYHQNILNEGGIFHITNDIQSIKNSNTLNATYEYLDDIHNSNKDFKYIWISFDNFEKHPNSDEWVVCPWGGGQSSSNYETLDNNNPRPATIQDGDRIVKGYGGKFYMPRLQRYAQGDNIQMRKYFFTLFRYLSSSGSMILFIFFLHLPSDLSLTCTTETLYDPVE